MNSNFRLNRRVLRRSVTHVAALTGVVLAVTQSNVSFAQAAGQKLPLSMSIYRGESLAASGIAATSWGSGLVQADSSKLYSGTESLRVTTHGLYQGADLKLPKPVDLSAYGANRNNFLTLAISLANASGAAGNAEAGAFSGFGGKFGGSAGPGSGSSFPYGGSGGGKFGGSAGPGAGSSFPYGGSGGGKFGGGGPGGLVQAQTNRKLENIRLVLVTTSGASVETMLPLASASEETEWKVLAIPVSSLSLPAGDSQIADIRIFGDAPATFNVGSIGVIEDSTPISVRPINDKTVQRLAKYQYVASASAGITPLVYSWDWDASDGIQDEAQGRGPLHIYRKASVDEAQRNTDFVVTLTVSDYYKIKAPVKVSFKVHVTP